MTNNIYEISEKGTKYILPLHFSTLEAGLQHCDCPEERLHDVDILWRRGCTAMLWRRGYRGGATVFMQSSDII